MQSFEYMTDKDKIIELLKRHSMYTLHEKNISIEDDGTINVAGDMVMNELGFPHGRLPVKFGVVEGAFSVSNTKLVTLEGSPHTCNIFTCSRTHIKNLIGGPKHVGYYFCNELPFLESLEGIAEYIELELYIADTPNLTSLHNIHKMVKHCEILHLGWKSIKSRAMGITFIGGLKNVSLLPPTWKEPSNNPALQIIRDCVNQKGDVHLCQEELFIQGFAEFAKL